MRAQLEKLRQLGVIPDDDYMNSKTPPGDDDDNNNNNIDDAEIGSDVVRMMILVMVMINA